MTLPYFLGCPSWNDPAWVGPFYPPKTTAREALGQYVQVFNTVEGNTTFYAWPSAETVARWAQHMPEHFRFCAKFPREISHAERLSSTLALAEQFIALMAPLGARLQPFWLQLPARFSPQDLPQLQHWLERIGVPVAVEVRNLAFFQKGDDERALNRLLHGLGVERICLDSRALFSVPASTPALIDAQRKKPRVPIRPAAFSPHPQVRFIGRPDLAGNDAFMQPWLDKVAQWIESGLQPHVYLHTPDNHNAPQLAMRFHQQLQTRLPGLPDLPRLAQPQADLLGGL